MPPAEITAPAGFEIDPRWQAVAEETLRRPPVPLPAPSTCAHLAFMTDVEQADGQRKHIHQLLEDWNLSADLDRFDQIVAAGEALTLKWERHTEFCSLTLIAPGDDLPGWPDFSTEWAAAMPGRLLVAIKIAVAPRSDRSGDAEVRDGPFPARARSIVNGGDAEVAVTYIREDDGYLHLKVFTDEVLEDRIGRLVQRLIEIETYRELALCAWPDVQALGPRLNRIDAGLAALTEELGDLAERGDDAERTLLHRLTDLARELEKDSAQTHFRLNASLAYADLVQRRLDELREERIEGSQRISSLINRRLRPAARTYRSILNRQAEMSERISRASDLLRSRIDVELAHQNQQLLASMNQRADQQLRLQQTVEGLSVVAISYYAIGIIGYLAAPLVHYFWEDADTKLLTGLSAPFVVLLVFLAIRRIRHSVTTPKSGASPPR